MAPKTIVMLNVGETTRDPRVRRVSTTLSRLGHRVVAVEPAGALATPRERCGEFEIVRFAGPRTFGADDMTEIERLSGRAGEIVRQAAPDVMDWDIGRFFLLWRRWQRRGMRAIRWAKKHVPNGFGPRLVDAAETALGFVEPPVDVQDVVALRSMMLINLHMARAALALRPDVVHANDLNTLLAAFMLKEKTGAPIIYDAHEIYPEQHAVDERSNLWHNFYTRLEEQLIQTADGRMTVCDSLGEYFQRRYGSGPFLTVRNVPSRRFLPSEEVLRRRNQPRKLLYHGAFFKNRGLEQVIRLAEHLDSVEILLRGFGGHERALRDLARQIGVERTVRFVPAVKVDELVGAASACDVGLNPFPSVCLNTEYALPNKFFEYMMAGLSIASSNLVELRRLTTELDVGILFRTLDPSAMAEDLRAHLRDPDRLDGQRERAWRAARDQFHWEIEERRLIDYYRDFV